MLLTIKPPPNLQPIANARSEKVITLPTNSVSLNGSDNDFDSSLTAYLWTKIAGPASYNNVSPDQVQTPINNLTQDTYLFELKVTDNHGAVSRDTMKVTVNSAPPPPNQPPVANAGADKVITPPINSITVSGSGTDSDGTIVTYQ
jgi:hypothetical protein